MSNRLRLPDNCWRGASGLYIARKLGLTSGLKLALDAGDGGSLPASATQFKDLSGNGYDFDLGSGVTQNGAPGGMSASEYLSFDGTSNGRLTYETTNEAWMDAIHKDSATATILFWAYFGSSATQGICGTSGADASAIGHFLSFTSSDNFNTGVQNGTGSDAFLNAASNPDAVVGAWRMYSMTLLEGNNSIRRSRNTDIQFQSCTFTSPSASASSYAMQIGAVGNDVAPLSSGSRIAMFLAWEGTALIQRDIHAFFDATRGRFAI